MELLSKCYEEGDWARLQTVIQEIIKQYDQNGYTKKAALLIEASQNAMGTQEVNSPSRSAMQTNRGSTLAGHGLNLFNQFVMPWMGDFKK